MSSYDYSDMRVDPAKAGAIEEYAFSVVSGTTYTFAGYQRSLGATGSPNVRIILKNATGGNGQASVFSDADAWTAFSVDFTPSTSEVLYVGMEADNIFFGSQVTQRWRYVTVTKV
jgi:hypothetical protein